MFESNDIYYCKHCKKIVTNLDDLLFVEEGSTNCFCSEVCIERFYAPLVDYFAGKIGKLGKDFHLDTDPAAALLEDSSVIDRALSRPDEIWHIENQLKEEFYIYIHHTEVEGKKAFLILLCFVFNKTPSFVLAMTATTNEYVLQKFRVGIQIESMAEFVKEQSVSADAGMIDQEIIDSVEFKKSKLLAEILEHQKETDISFENFELYSDYISDTLTQSDEIYKYNDDEGDDIKTYIKAFQKDGVSFFYIVICLFINSDDDHDAVIPIISFPTIDGDMCKYFRKGEHVFGGLKN